ncbi:MAG: NADH:flavin oxidoreductase [Anaerovoracaceae bacterium]|jgi:NADPH2 dehydrogenase
MKLKDPITVKGLQLVNRLVMPPMATHKAKEGKVPQELCDYYAARAAGSYVGLVITEHSYIDPRGKADPYMVSVADDCDMDSLCRLTEAIHEAGDSRVFCQMNHAGSSTSSLVTGTRLEAPSAVLHPTWKDAEMPLEMSRNDIERVVEEFAASAGRAKKAGYDGVEIHSAHGYLLNQFYSPLTNRRSDRYGGETVAERLTIHKEVIAAVRSEVGDSFPVAMRLGGCDYMEGGSTIEDSVTAAGILEKAGIDLLDITGGMCRYMIVDGKEPGFFSDMTTAIKKKIKIPVILTGGIRTVEDAERFLNNGAADMIGIARPMLKDAAWAKTHL